MGLVRASVQDAGEGGKRQGEMGSQGQDSRFCQDSSLPAGLTLWRPYCTTVATSTTSSSKRLHGLGSMQQTTTIQWLPGMPGRERISFVSQMDMMLYLNCATILPSEVVSSAEWG